jgi:thioredoxin-dependent peroxiredoxin
MRRTEIVVTLLIAALLVVGAAAPVAALQVGEKAPDFTLPATTAEKFSLSQFQGKSNVVLFGFIGAFTPT